MVNAGACGCRIVLKQWHGKLDTGYVPCILWRGISVEDKMKHFSGTYLISWSGL